MSVVIAVDQGTTSTKAVAVDADGRVVAAASEPVVTRTPRPGWVEQDPVGLWDGVTRVVLACADAVGHERVAGLAVANQRESVVAWRRPDGRPVGPLLSWQDVRGGSGPAMTDEVADLVERRTGVRCDPMFSAPKMRWLLEQTSDPDVVVGTVDAWLVWNLTGGAVFVTEAGNASRTLLFDLDARAWSGELLDVFGVSAERLPLVVDSDGEFGRMAPGGMLPGVPILGVLPDSHAALFAQGDDVGGAVKVTYGTGSSLMRPRPSSARAPEGISTTVAWVCGGRPAYAWEGNVRYSGAALEWTARLIGTGDVDTLLSWAGSVPGSEGVDVVPAFGGLGAPYWDPRASGVIVGLSASTTPAHVARAAVDAVALQVDDVLLALGAQGEAETLLADGGATRSRLLMQTQADLSGVPVWTVGDVPLAALGAARLAAGRLGWPAPPPPRDCAYRPGAGVVRDERRAQWREAVDRARGPRGDDLDGTNERS